MLRDKNLIPLSHQHQRALALCVRLSRAAQAGEIDVDAWRTEITQLYEQEIAIHFAAEEQEVFPQAEKFPGIHAVVQELRAEHEVLREFLSRLSAGGLDRAGLVALGEKLVAHIRKEERHLFEAMQQHMTTEELAAIGAALERALAEASRACAVPSAATRLRTKQS